MNDVFAAVAAIVFLVAPASQEPEHSPFGCEAAAVDILVDGHPRLRFEAIERPPLFTAHEFTFKASPVGLVRIYLTATLPEEEVGRESTAQLTVYAETAASLEHATSGTSGWWRLVGLQRPSQSFDTSHGLSFAASQVAGCFGGRSPGQECGFADVSLATTDEDLPLIVIGFTQNLGGANAQNWTDGRLLLDFRSLPPKVTATLDCSYNEGGGACTAIDSSMSPRLTLECRWAADAKDFLCTETTSEAHGAHRDFYLFANHLAPARESELASLEQAAAVLARKGKGQTVTVHKLGPVSFVDEVGTHARTSGMLLAAGGAFYLAPRAASGTIGRVLGIVPHNVLDPSSPAEPVGLPEGRWTADDGPRFASQLISRAGGVSVLQVVATTGDPEPPSGDPDSSSELYWIGVQHAGGGFAFDAVRLVAAGRYERCGNAIVPPVVVAIGDIGKPFTAKVRVQPTTSDSIFDEGEPEWSTESEGQPVDRCIRNATVSWRSGAFTTEVDRRPCASPDKPHRVGVNTDGRLRLDAGSERKE